jgi:glycosyltransferase involved in cell wall biosynthesis
MRAQRAAGFKVELACRPGEDAAQIAAEGFPLHPIAFERSYNLWAHARAWRSLSHLIQHRRPTVVHTHTPIASLIARPVARRWNVPIILYTAHGFYFHDRMSPWARRIHIGLERVAQRRADFLFTQSAEDLETAISKGIAPQSRAMAIGNGVDLNHFRPEELGEGALREGRCQLGLDPTDGPVVIVIGRLVREKGYLEFLQAMEIAHRQFPSARAIVIGQALESDHDGSAAQIRAEARRLGLEGVVRFVGARDDVERLLTLGDLFCLPSWREGMPRSIIEAMAVGLPVVATDIRGCREEVVHGETGLLVPVRDPVGLAAGLSRLMGDPMLRRKMGEAGRRRAVERFDEKGVIERQMACLGQLFKEKGMVWPL